jgi:peptidoglycan-associated lipoprotein
MTRQCHLALVAVLVAASLAGCAQEASKTSPVPATTSSEPPATPPPPPAVTQEPPPATPAPSMPPAPGVVAAVAPTTVPPPPAEEFIDHPAIKDVFFESGRADIGRQGAATMGRNVRWLLDNADYLLLVEGHTDATGPREGNYVIAQRRAASAVSFLVESGVPVARLHTVSYGADRPTCQAKSDACAAKNRRVHFRLKRP